MSVQTITLAAVVVTASCNLTMAQSPDAPGNCVCPVGTSSVNSGLDMWQSRVLSTRTFPVTTRLLSSRIVATGFAPATQFNSLNSMSTFGSASGPLTTSFVSNSAPVVQSFTNFGSQSNVGFPATFAAPSTFTFTPLATANLQPGIVQPATVNVLAPQIANDGCRSSTVSVKRSATSSCCSSETLASFSNRIEALDRKLSLLEKSLDQQDDDIGELLPDDSKAGNDQPKSSGDPIDELLGGSVE